MIEQDALISEYSHEKFRTREAEALHLLRKVASIVKPIMRQRTWRVGTLAEFYPAETSLLGLNTNRGQKIHLRLRYPHDDKQFLPLESVVDTMLHELCHIVFGPHDENFHNLWNQLRDEHEALARKGYTGEGFLSTGHKLGGRRMPIEEARRQARAAAERRKTQAGSGQRLGGHGASRGQDIRLVIANAAQRRRDILRGCASDSHDDKWKERIVREASKNGFTTKAEEDDANEEAIMQAYIELVQEEEMEKLGQNYEPPSNHNPVGRRSFSRGVGLSSDLPPPPSIPFFSKPGSNPHPPEEAVDEDLDIVSSSSPPARTSTYNDAWSCPTCTLNNPPTYLCCDACGTERPTPVSSKNTPDVSQKSAASGKASSKPKPSKGVLHNSAADNLTRFAQAEREAAQRRPVGWHCHSCGNFVDSQWWTCSRCGSMKLAS